jgi:hypothetical protein
VSEPRALVLVEGVSDVNAVEALAARRCRDLAAEGVVVRPIGGAHAIARVLFDVPDGLPVVGLCDENEASVFARAAARVPERHFEFFVCRADLEDELLRALGLEAAEMLLSEHGDLRSFRTLQKQPAWQGYPAARQLRGFLHSSDSRKLRYARILVDALPDDLVPAPLEGLLAAASRDDP